MKYFVFNISAVLISIILFFISIDLVSFGDDIEIVSICIYDTYFVTSIYMFLLFLFPILCMFIIAGNKIYNRNIKKTKHL